MNPALSELSKLRSKIEDIFNKENLFDDLTRKNIILAVTELFVNIVKHGQLPRRKNVKFHVIKLPASFELILFDSGNSYNPSDVKLPDISELPENGFGLYLVNSLMDSFEYQPKNNTCKYNITKIIKKI